MFKAKDGVAKPQSTFQILSAWLDSAHTDDTALGSSTDEPGLLSVAVFVLHYPASVSVRRR